MFGLSSPPSAHLYNTACTRHAKPALAGVQALPAPIGRYLQICARSLMWKNIDVKMMMMLDRRNYPFATYIIKMTSVTNFNFIYVRPCSCYYIIITL